MQLPSLVRSVINQQVKACAENIKHLTLQIADHESEANKLRYDLKGWEEQSRILSTFLDDAPEA